MTFTYSSLLTYRPTIVKVSYFVGIASLFLMPDVIFGLLMELLHLLMELLHVLFEFVEIALDTIIEHTFHTDVHQTQIIVFYTIWALGLGLLYCLKGVVTRYYRRTQAKLLNACLNHKLRFVQYWSTLFVVQKT